MKKVTNTNGRAGVDHVLNEKPKTKTIEILNPVLESQGFLELELEGTSPLIIQRFPEKAKRQIAAKQQGLKVAKNPPKVPEAEFLDALHVIGKRPKTREDLKHTHFGIPAVSFKLAIIRMAKYADLVMTDMKALVFVVPDSVEDGLVEFFTDKPPVMREDPVRLESGVADLRYRPMFEHWSIKLRVNFNARHLTAEQLVSLFVAAGQNNGVGEWRPFGRETTGTFGCWKITRASATIPDFTNGK